MSAVDTKARNRAYVRKHVDNMKELGYTNTQVWIDQPGTAALNEMKRRTGWTKAEIISRALQMYQQHYDNPVE